MAEEVAIDIKVGTGEAGKSLYELRREFKEISAELNKSEVGSQKFKDTLLKLGEVKGQMKELQRAIGELDPNKKFQTLGDSVHHIAGGFEAATAATALFGDKSKGLEETLVKVQAAMAFTQGIQSISLLGESFKNLGLILKANPIFLIASVIIGIGVALYELKDKIPGVAKAFEYIGNVIDTVKNGFKDFTDSIGLTSFKMDEAREKQTKAAKDLADAEEKMWERRLKYAQAAGKDTIEIERKLNDARLQNLKEQAKEVYLKAFSEHRQLTEEEKKQLDEIKDKAINVYTEIEVKNIEHHKKLVDEAKKENDKRKNLLDELKPTIDNSIDSELKAIEDADKLADKSKKEYWDNQLKYADHTIAELDKKNEEAAKKERALAQWVSNEKKALGRSAFIAAKDLTDTLFSNALLKAHGNANEEHKIKRNQFNVSKAIAATNAGINTAEAITKTIAELGGVGAITPPGIALIAAMGAIGAAEIAAIVGKKFPESGESGGGSINIPNISPSGGGTNAPSIQSPQASNNRFINTTNVNQTTNGNFAGFQQQQQIKAYVVETEISDSQKRIKSIQENSKY